MFTWAHRDRTIIQDQLVDHFGGSIGPEAGTSYTIRVYKLVGDTTPIRTVGGITGTTWTYTSAMRSADAVGDNVIFELESTRGGLLSQVKYRFRCQLSANPFTSCLIHRNRDNKRQSLSHVDRFFQYRFVQFFRTTHGSALNQTTNKLGGQRALNSSFTVSISDTPGSGSWDYYAQQPISSAV